MSNIVLIQTLNIGQVHSSDIGIQHEVPISEWDNCCMYMKKKRPKYEIMEDDFTVNTGGSNSGSAGMISEIDSGEGETVHDDNCDDDNAANNDDEVTADGAANMIGDGRWCWDEVGECDHVEISLAPTRRRVERIASPILVVTFLREMAPSLIPPTLPIL